MLVQDRGHHLRLWRSLLGALLLCAVAVKREFYVRSRCHKGKPLQFGTKGEVTAPASEE